MNGRMLIIIGDEAIRTVIKSSPVRPRAAAGAAVAGVAIRTEPAPVLLDRLRDRDVQVILITSDSSTYEQVQPYVTRDPLHVQAVHLGKYAALTPECWHAPGLVTREQEPFLYDDLGRYAAGNDAGAVSIADGAARVFFTSAVRQALDRAMTREMTRPLLHGEEANTRVTVLASAFRCTGCGATPPILAEIVAAAQRVLGRAQVEIDVIIATQSVEHAGEDGRKAAVGRRALLSTLELAEGAGMAVGPALSLPPGRLGVIFEVGAPGLNRGMLPDDQQARQALALILELYALGPVSVLVDSRRMHTMEDYLPQRTSTGADVGRRRRFAGLGALEVLWTPAAGRDYLAAHLLAGLPPPATTPGPVHDLLPPVRQWVATAVRERVKTALAGVLPPAREVNADTEVVEPVRARMWRVAEAQLPGLAAEAIAKVQDQVELERLGELSTRPFAADRYAALTAEASAVPPLCSPEALQNDLNGRLKARLGEPERRLRDAAGRRWGRSGAVESALPETEAAVRMASGQIEALFTDQVMAMVGGVCGKWATAQLAQVVAALAEATQLTEPAERGRFDETLARTEIARGDTPAGHRFSVPPAPGVVRAYAAAVDGVLFTVDGRVSEHFWSRFGSWCSLHPEALPEKGAAATAAAVRAVARAVAEEVLPDTVTLADLYRVGGQSLPVTDWEHQAQPRVKASPAARPAVETMIEAPATLVNAPEWNALDRLHRATGSDAYRIRMLRCAYGYTFESLLRGDGDDFAAMLGDAAATAPTPVVEQAIRDRLIPALMTPAAAPDVDPPFPMAEVGPGGPPPAAPNGGLPAPEEARPQLWRVPAVEQPAGVAAPPVDFLPSGPPRLPDFFPVQGARPVVRDFMGSTPPTSTDEPAA